jgi:hypothetical protein
MMEKDMSLTELCEVYASRIRAGEFDKEKITRIAERQWDNESASDNKDVDLFGRIRWLTNVRIVGSDKVHPLWWQIAFQAEWDGPMGDKFESGSFFLVNYVAAVMDSPDINTAAEHMSEISENFGNEPWPLMMIRDEVSPHYAECLEMNDKASEDLRVWLAMR